MNKKTIITILLVLVAMAGQAQEIFFRTDSASIIGKIAGLETEVMPKQIIVAWNNALTNNMRDKTVDVSADGDFTCRMQLHHPVLSNLVISENNMVPFYLMPGETLHMELKQDAAGHWTCNYGDGSAAKKVERLRKEQLISYDFHYLTGNYPEGNALLDLYIHPLDLVTFLFGKPEILACQQVAPASYILMLRHPHIVGTLELSTAYTWTSAEESLKVCTSKGIYRLSQMEELTFEPKPSSLLGIPYEKIHKHNKTVEHLYTQNNFIPTLPNNQIYSQGYYSEIQSFITSVEHGHSSVLTDITIIKPTYEGLMGI